MSNNNKMNRRNFFKKSAAGTAAISFYPGGLLSSKVLSAEPESKIIKRKLGKTGLELPVVSMGVMNADNPNLLRAAYNKGIVHFDTAHRYQRGNNEEMCGEVFKNMPRDSFVISTKIPSNKYDVESGEWEIKTDVTEFVENFEKSLKRLQMDHVDFLYLHGKSNKQEVMEEDFVNAMVKLKKQGKARFIGVSTHRNEPEVINAVTDSNIYDIVLTAYNFRQDHNKSIAEAIKRASEGGIGVIAMKTQAGVHWDEEGEKKKINMKAALKWVLQNPHVHTAIPGFETFNQLNEDLEVLSDIDLSIEEMRDLKLADDMGMLGLYCDQCDRCKFECKANFDIPTLMRSYMYAFGYKNYLLAKDTLLETDLMKLPCEDCSECSVACRMGYNVKERLSSIYELKNIPDKFLV